MNPAKQMPPPNVGVGEIVGGKYRVERLVAEGGMGIVFAAKHLMLDEQVALKFLRPEVAQIPELVARFTHEARAAVKLKGENVARVFDVGTRESGDPYIVMELLEGTDLREILNDRGGLLTDVAADYLIQACAGLAEAHARGIVHRDIKPENLFIVDNGSGWRTLKVLDFGISKAALSGHDQAAVKTSFALGSPCYMSPEQLRTLPDVDARADIWALGAVLFELLAGTTPYDGTLPLTSLVATILEQEPRKLAAYREDVPEGLVAIVNRCLQKRVADRFSSVAELAIALLEFAPRRSRVAAERATSLANATTSSSGTVLRMPPSVLPGPLSGGIERTSNNSGSGAPVSVRLVPNSAPRISAAEMSASERAETLIGGMAPAEPSRITSSRPAAAMDVPTSAAPADATGKRGLVIPLVLGVLVLGGAGAIFMAMNGGTAPAPAGAKPIASGVSAPTTTVATTPDPPIAATTVPPPAIAPSESAAPAKPIPAVAAVASGPPAGAQKPVPQVATPPRRTPSQPSAAPVRNPDFDIQMNR